MNTEQIIDQLKFEKDRLKDIQEYISQLEQQLIKELGCKEEGSQTHTVGDHKVTITGKVNRTFDKSKWSEIEHQIPENLRPVEYKPALDTKGLKYLENNEPDVYKLIAQAITEKPGKPYVQIKE